MSIYIYIFFYVEINNCIYWTSGYRRKRANEILYFLMIAVVVLLYLNFTRRVCIFLRIFIIYILLSRNGNKRIEKTTLRFVDTRTTTMMMAARRVSPFNRFSRSSNRVRRSTRSSFGLPFRGTFYKARHVDVEGVGTGCFQFTGSLSFQSIYKYGWYGFVSNIKKWTKMILYSPDLKPTNNNERTDDTFEFREVLKTFKKQRRKISRTYNVFIIDVGRTV